MQFSKCSDCIHNGAICKMIMAETMNLCNTIEYTINYAQTRQTEHKCKLKIDYDCENFEPQEHSKEATYGV